MRFTICSYRPMGNYPSNTQGWLFGVWDRQKQEQVAGWDTRLDAMRRIQTKLEREETEDVR